MALAARSSRTLRIDEAFLQRFGGRAAAEQSPFGNGVARGRRCGSGPACLLGEKRRAGRAGEEKTPADFGHVGLSVTGSALLMTSRGVSTNDENAAARQATPPSRSGL